MKILTQNFYQNPPEKVARELLGKILVRRISKDLTLSGIIIETEAYLAQNDTAAHAHKGKTEKNKALFLEGGHAYVHQIHGYYCLDAVCQQKDIPGSVLIRAIEPLEGVIYMQKNRNLTCVLNIASGPGKLCQALEIDKTFNGTDLTNTDSQLAIYADDTRKKEYKIGQSPRIGITQSKDYLLRFYYMDHPHVSHLKRSPTWIIQSSNTSIN